MLNFISWTVTFLFCVGCVFSYKAEPDGYNLTTIVTFSNKGVGEKVSSKYSIAIDPNSINKDLLSTKQDAVEATTAAKPNQNDWINFVKFYTSKSAANTESRFTNYTSLLQPTNVQKSPDNTKNPISTDMQSYYKNLLRLAEIRHKTLSGILGSPAIESRGNLGSYCNSDLNCPLFTTCKDFKCACADHYVQKGDKCLVSMVGYNCTTSQECPEFGFCKSGKCACEKGYTQVMYWCGETWPGHPCNESLQCPVRSYCNNGSCVCKPGYFIKNNECIEKDKVECYSDNDCQKLKRNSTCFVDAIGNVCKCPFGYEDVGSECLLKSTWGLGGSCKLTSQCPLNSWCSDGICVCQDRYVKRDEACVTNDECTENYDCQQRLKYSVCLKFNRNECHCLPDYVAALGECHLRVSLGSYCKHSIQCPRWSLCIDGICICSNGFVRKGSTCGKESYTPMPNFLLALIAGIVFLIVVSCLFVIIMALRRKVSRMRRTASDDPPTVSSVVDAGQLVTPDPAYERVDKPPTYDEAMSSSTTLLTLSVQDIASEPPSYNQVQQSRNGLIPGGS